MDKDDVDSQESDEVATGDASRPAWDNKFQYIMAALGFAVGLGNIWRFPYLCHKNGGGAFLIPYFTMLLLEGFPLYFLELAVGQSIRKGAVGVWSSINPKLAGIGFAGIVVSLLIGLYYNVILAWALYYFFYSFRSELLWASCPADGNGTAIQECELSSSTEYFWYRETLNISHTIEDGSEINPPMVLSLFIAWVIVFCGIMKGIKTSGKVMYFATIFPYVILIAFFVRGMTLEGAAAGVQHMFKPNVTKLANPDVWREAATQIFFSLGLGYGAIIAYSSYNPRNNNCKKDALFVATANSITSVFACITVFSVLGFKAHLSMNACMERNHKLAALLPDFEYAKNWTSDEFWQQVVAYNASHPGIVDPRIFENCSIEKELSQIGQGTGLAFIAFAETILNFPAAPVWAVLFFFMLLNIGMSSEFGILQGFITVVLDSGCKLPKVAITGGLCIVMFLLGLIFTMRSGNYFLELFDNYSATFGLVAVALGESVAVAWVYGIDNFTEDIHRMINSKPGWYWKISWKFVCPVIMAAILVSSLVNLFIKAPEYDGWNDVTGHKDTMPYPGWAVFLIVMLILSSVICIPLFALLHWRGWVDTERFAGLKHERNKRDEAQAGEEFGVTESAQPLTSMA